jgi:hypothetical protein
MSVGDLGSAKQAKGAESMRDTRSSLSTALLVAISALGAAGAFAADRSPEEALNRRGLKRSGLLFVLDADAEFVPKVAKLQPKYRQLKGQFDKLATVLRMQAEYDLLDDQWTLVNEQLRNVQAEIDAHPPTTNNELKQNWQNLLEAERQLRLQYNALRTEVNLRYKRLASDSEKEQLRSDFLKQRDDFLDSSRELRAQADKIKDDYNALSKDDEVKKSLSELKASTKASVSLGPSPSFKKASDWLISAVKLTSPDSLAPKAKKKNTTRSKSTTKGKGAMPGKKRSSTSAKTGTGDNRPASGGPVAGPK